MPVGWIAKVRALPTQPWGMSAAPCPPPQVDVMLRDGFPALIDALVAKGGLDIRMSTSE